MTIKVPGREGCDEGRVVIDGKKGSTEREPCGRFDMVLERSIHWVLLKEVFGAWEWSTISPPQLIQYVWRIQLLNCFKEE